MNSIVLTATGGGDTISNLGQSITNLILWIQPLAPYLLLVALGISGVLLLIPSSQFHQKVMKILPVSMIGFFIIMAVIQIAADIQSKIVF